MGIFKQVNAIVIHVQDIQQGIDYYGDKLGLELAWKDDNRAGFVLGESKLVLSTVLDPETNILVESVEAATKQLMSSGGKLIAGPEDIPVGKLAIVEDPFGNKLTLIDYSKGYYSTDDEHNIIGVLPIAK